MTSSPNLSIVIPAYQEAEWIGHCVRAARASLRAQGEKGEIIVCDGGSEDATRLRARRAGATRVIDCGVACRPTQINEGAGQATGATLAVLHADALVRPEWVASILESRRQGYVGGWAGLRILAEFDQHATIQGWLDLMARGINWRTRVFRTATGDQGIFVDRQVFEAIGGVPEVPIMDGYALARRIRENGPVAVLGPWLRISGRRWEQGGPVRTMLLMFAVRAGWTLGLEPGRLKRWWRRFSTGSP